VALRVRWPGLAQDIDQEPELLAELERNANDLPLSDEALRQQYRWFDRDEVANVLREPEDSRRINALPFQDFLQVA
jgi:hypothetical protein